MLGYPKDPRLVNTFYNESHRLVRFLSRESKKKFSELLQLLASGKKFETALFRAYGGRFPNIKMLEQEFLPYASKDHKQK